MLKIQRNELIGAVLRTTPSYGLHGPLQNYGLNPAGNLSGLSPLGHLSGLSPGGHFSGFSSAGYLSGLNPAGHLSGLDLSSAIRTPNYGVSPLMNLLRNHQLPPY